ncbi:hypothetical protein [Phreatobacter sp.]|uniref:hypothetical protein n=1 Tax=Phreatobacter sp. TaxID=1966341 RepID=UPI003F6F1D42
MGLTRNDLVEIARREVSNSGGPPVSERTIRDWVDEGLLPRAEARGRGRGRSPDWVYPDAAADRLVAIIRIRRFGRHRTDSLRLQLWSRGHDFPIHEIMDALQREFERFVKFFRRMARWNFDHREARNSSIQAIRNYRQSLGELDPDIASVGIQFTREALLITGSFVINGSLEPHTRSKACPSSQSDWLEKVVGGSAGLLALDDEDEGSGLERLLSLSEEQLLQGRTCFQLIESCFGICGALAGIHIPVLADKIRLLEQKILNTLYRPEWHTPFLAACILIAPQLISEILRDDEQDEEGTSTTEN